MATVQSRAPRKAGRIAAPDPAYFVWRRFTSVRFAIGLILVTVSFGLAGVIIPQVPPQLLNNPETVRQHIEDQRGTWGWFTDVLAEFPWFYDAHGGIFNLFNQPYWWALIAVLAMAITTCTISRFPPIWRTVRRPPRRVNDAYFERARHRFDFATPPNADLIAAEFRHRHYSVRTEERDGATYIFADRFQWAQLATFVSHLGLILLVLGALITKFAGEEFQFWVGEGQSRPLFATAGDRQQIQVIVDDAIARFNDEGQALDFRSAVRVTRGGEQIAAGDVTVNGPLHAAGYRVHQAAYWEHGAALQVRHVDSRQLLYSEILMLDQQFIGPRIKIASAARGAFLADEVVKLSREVAGVDGSGYELVPLGAESSIALVLTPAPSDGEFEFSYTLLPYAADSDRNATLDAEALRLHVPPLLAPQVRLYDAASGELLLDDVIPANDRALEGRRGVRFDLLPLGAGREIAVGYDETDLAAGDEERRFFYFNLQDDRERGLLAAGGRAALGEFVLEYVGAAPDRSQHGVLQPGESQRIGGVELTYGGVESVFYRIEEDVPGAEAEALILLERFGGARTAEQFDARGGENVELAVADVETFIDGASRPARLGLGLGGGRPRVDLSEGESIVLGDFEYSFLGPREFTGLNVRRDPGALIFWIAIGLGLGAFLVTFFAPRRRIWVKVTPQRTYMAGLVGHGVSLRREFKRFARQVGSPDAPPDDDPDYE